MLIIRGINTLIILLFGVEIIRNGLLEFFTIKGHQVGLEANELMDVVNLKCEPDLIPNLIHESGIYPAYHMNKQHWISVDIERYEDIEKLKMMVDMSYRLVEKR